MGDKIKYLSLFSGVGSPEMALRDLGIDYELIGFSEIEAKAVKSYCAIHNVDEEMNLGDITKINIEALPKGIDLITHGSPCQDFSAAGKNLGGEKGSGTRSSLIWNTVDIVAHSKPKYVIWENVKNVLTEKHKNVVDTYLLELEGMGYNNYIKVLNAKDYGIPQSRERVFIVSILKEHDFGFSFPNKQVLKTEVKDYMDFREKDDVTFNFKRRYEEKFGAISDEDFSLFLEALPTRTGIGTKKLGLYSFNEMDTITTIDSLTGTLTCSNLINSNKKFLYNGRLYKASPLMAWRLMGFSDEDFYKALNSEGQSDISLYKQAGNSIALPVIKEILRSLLLNK